MLLAQKNSYRRRKTCIKKYEANSPKWAEGFIRLYMRAQPLMYRKMMYCYCITAMDYSQTVLLLMVVIPD